jgi:hypothetical protein
MDFTIDEQFLTDVPDIKITSLLEDPENPTNEDLIKILKNRHRMISTGSNDHSEFAKLRVQLGKDGFINIEYSWWNGDYVLKPFTLNGVQFKKDDKFVCAAAMKGHLKFASIV